MCCCSCNKRVNATRAVRLPASISRGGNDVVVAWRLWLCHCYTPVQRRTQRHANVYVDRRQSHVCSTSLVSHLDFLFNDELLHCNDKYFVVKWSTSIFGNIFFKNRPPTAKTARCFVSSHCHLRSLKIIENDIIRKPGYSFLFAFHTFSRLARYCPKIAIFSYPLHSTPHIRGSSSEYCHNVLRLVLQN